MNVLQHDNDANKYARARSDHVNNLWSTEIASAAAIIPCIKGCTNIEHAQAM